jgi:hypothetical protein
MSIAMPIGTDVIFCPICLVPFRLRRDTEMASVRRADIEEAASIRLFREAKR